MCDVVLLNQTLISCKMAYHRGAVSPILFNIVIDDLFHDLPEGLSSSLFADDSAIWCTDHQYEQSLPRIQEALNRVDKWSKNYGFLLLAPKSAMMNFGKRLLRHHLEHVRV